jgi:hypothetical protein
MFAARVITDRISGYSRGFGFVKYATVEEAGEGIKGMDGKVSASINRGNALPEWFMIIPGVVGLIETLKGVSKYSWKLGNNRSVVS